MRSVFTVLLAAIISLATICASALAATMDFLGAWNATATYATGKVIKYNGVIYYSLRSTAAAPNRNRIPSAEPTWWEPVGTTTTFTNKRCSPGTFLTGFDASGNFLCAPMSRYEYVAAPGITWESAASLAQAKSTNSLSCYLATLSSQQELDYVEAVIIPGGASTGNIYIGSRRTPGTVDRWYWAFGPETGVVFWQNGAAVGNNFPGWDPMYGVESIAAAPYGNLNNYFRPYVSAIYGTALPTLTAGGNSGYLVECTPR